MGFKKALDETIVKSTKKFEEQYLERLAYKQLDKFLKRESENYRKLSKKIRDNTINTIELLQTQPFRNSQEVDYWNKSFILDFLRGELKQIGLLEFLTRHPEYAEKAFYSRTNFINKRIQQYLKQQLN
jgi:hypothetical protein